MNSSTILHPQAVELLFVGDVFRDVLQAAVQRRTQFVQRLCFHVVIGPQTPDGLAVDAALFPELIGGNSLFFHHIPQLIKNNHDLTLLIDTNQYGGYNLHS